MSIWNIHKTGLFRVPLLLTPADGMRAPNGTQGKRREAQATPRCGVACASLLLRAGLGPASMTKTEKPCTQKGLVCVRYQTRDKVRREKSYFMTARSVVATNHFPPTPWPLV